MRDHAAPDTALVAAIIREQFPAVCPTIQAVLSTYDGPLDAAALPCAQFLGACRGVADVAFGLETGRREYVDAGIRALRLCVSAR